jgi:glycosyltransferase involved in cell wall biosynthesis
VSQQRPIYFNGKFYAGRLNGVHRVADRLIRECDRLLEALPIDQRPEAILFAPENSTWLPKLNAIQIRLIRNAGQFWEQCILPARSRNGVLVNLANLAPIFHHRKLTMVHDAQFLMPDCGYPLRQRLGYRLLSPNIARSSRYTLTVSDYSRRMLDKLGVARPEKTIVIANGADHILEVAEDSRLRNDLHLVENGYVVMFGSSKPYKNNAVVFAAFADGKLGPTKLVVVGMSEAELRHAGLHVPEGTVFTGKINDRTLRGLLAQATALAFPSKTEGFGLPPLEAMLCDCPVVTSPAGAIPEVCGDAAIYAAVDDPAAWQQAIEALRDNAPLRSEKITAGRQRANLFTWKAAGQRLYDVIEEVRH